MQILLSCDVSADGRRGDAKSRYLQRIKKNILQYVSRCSKQSQLMQGRMKVTH